MRVVNRNRYEERPTGKSTCYESDGKTTCYQEMKEIRIPYQELVEMDLNEYRRDPHIEQCTIEKCMAKYGNEKCEPK